MNPHQQFMQDMQGWMLALGFVSLVLIGVFVWLNIYHNTAPVEWVGKWLEHRRKIALLKAQARLTRDYNPEYIKFLEENQRKEQ